MATVSNRPWSDFAASDYSIEQWRRACLIDRGEGDPDSKARYAVPVREPSGALNRNGIHAAAGGHGIGAVRGVSAEAKRAAARKLVALYRDALDETPPDSMMAMAGMMRSNQEGPATMTELQYRSYRPDLQVRSGGDGRTIMGIAVPYNAPTRISDDLVEQFARGAFNHQLREPHRVRFAREHLALGGTLIGAASLLRDDAAGLYVELRASKTPTGDETLELVKDGAISHLSIAFAERQNRRLTGGITERVKAHLGEVAATLEGAYGDLAAAMGVRSGQPQWTAPTGGVVESAALRARAEEYLLGLPDPPDRELEVRSVRLGIPF